MSDCAKQLIEAGPNTSLLLDHARRISDMADKVAGFSISSNLLLAFAALRDLGSWVKGKTHWFLAGVVIAGMLYAGAVWFLHAEEFSALSDAKISTAAVNRYIDLLSGCRIAGIALFTVIAFLAVFGTSKGIPEDDDDAKNPSTPGPAVRK